MSKAEIEFAAENAQKLNDLISRSALLEKSFSTAPATMINPYGGESVVRVEDIENAPAVPTTMDEVGLVVKALATADLVPVVRCGECIHRHDPRRFSCQGRRKDWFCADGVRRKP